MLGKVQIQVFRLHCGSPDSGYRVMQCALTSKDKEKHAMLFECLHKLRARGRLISGNLAECFAPRRFCGGAPAFQRAPLARRTLRAAVS